MAIERDQALREKVFNEAKAEVMALSKKVGKKQIFSFSPTVSVTNVVTLTEFFPLLPFQC